MTNNSSIEQRLVNVIATKTKLPESDIQPDLNLEGSGLDSFARIELILLIEQEFGIELSDAESADIATVADITKLVESKT